MGLVVRAPWLPHSVGRVVSGSVVELVSLYKSLAELARPAPWFLQRALLTPGVTPGSHYRCAKST